MTQYDSAREPQVSGWALGGIGFAGTLMILIGAFQSIAGLAAIFDDEFYVVTQNYVFDLNVTAWGWIHLILGILILCAGIALLSRKLWAGLVALALAVFSAVANFFFIPYYPFWALLEIALAVWVIWALTRPGALKT